MVKFENINPDVVKIFKKFGIKEEDLKSYQTDVYVPVINVKEATDLISALKDLKITGKIFTPQKGSDMAKYPLAVEIPFLLIDYKIKNRFLGSNKDNKTMEIAYLDSNSNFKIFKETENRPTVLVHYSGFNDDADSYNVIIQAYGTSGDKTKYQIDNGEYLENELFYSLISFPSLLLAHEYISNISSETILTWLKDRNIVKLPGQKNE